MPDLWQYLNLPICAACKAFKAGLGSHQVDRARPPKLVDVRLLLR